MLIKAESFNLDPVDPQSLRFGTAIPVFRVSENFHRGKYHFFHGSTLIFKLLFEEIRKKTCALLNVSLLLAATLCSLLSKAFSAVLCSFFNMKM